MPAKKLLFDFLRCEICGKPLPNGIEKALTDEVFTELYDISNSQDLAHLLSDVLIKNGLVEKDTEIGQKFFSSQVLAVYRYENINFTLDKVCSLLENSKISFIPLKGSVIREYYPESWMRTSSDIDILVHPEDFEKTLSLLQQNGYKMSGRTSHDVTLRAQNGVHIELHFSLLEESYLFPSNHILQNPWDYPVPHSGCRYSTCFTDEML